MTAWSCGSGRVRCGSVTPMYWPQPGQAEAAVRSTRATQSRQSLERQQVATCGSRK